MLASCYFIIIIFNPMDCQYFTFIYNTIETKNPFSEIYYWSKTIIKIDCNWTIYFAQGNWYKMPSMLPISKLMLIYFTSDQ